MWKDFLLRFEARRASSIVSGLRLSHPRADESRRSSGQSTLSVSSAAVSAVQSRRTTLQRTHTFDDVEASKEKRDSLQATAHSTRSHSCIAPVDISIRRLSGNVFLTEEPSLDADGNPNPTIDDESFESSSCPSPPPIPSAGSSTRSSFAITQTEEKRREALWDLFQSECVFLYDHLMVMKNVFMEPLKKIQVEGFAMFAEPEVLFGNLDELCCVTYAFCKEMLSLILHQMNAGELNATEVLVKLFQKVGNAMAKHQMNDRCARTFTCSPKQSFKCLVTGY